MSRYARRAVNIGAAIVIFAGLASGCGTNTITSAALSTSVGPTFARLYALQQVDKGPQGSSRKPDGIAQCFRGAPASKVLSAAPATGKGPGDDWSCILNFPYPDGHIEPITYDLSVQATGCFVASGPSTIVGPQTFTTASGRTVTNPLFEFDGCLDLH